MTTSVCHVLVEMVTLSMEPLANNVPTSAKTAAHPQPPALPASIPPIEISVKDVPV